MAIGIGHPYVRARVRVPRRPMIAGAARANGVPLSLARERSGTASMRRVLLALFLIDLAAGLYLFLPLVGRRNAGVKFYRLILIIGARARRLRGRSRTAMAGRRDLAIADARDRRAHAARLVRPPLSEAPRSSARPRRSSAPRTSSPRVAAYHAAVRPSHIAWSIAGALASIALLGSVNLAMLLGHWYLVVRGMSIDPLKRLTIATLVASIVEDRAGRRSSSPRPGHRR